MSKSSQEFKTFMKIAALIYDESLLCPANPVGNNMFKVNIRITRKRCEICLKLIIKTPEGRQCRRSGVFIVNFEHISPCSSVFIVNCEQVHAGWEWLFTSYFIARSSI